MSSTMHSLFLLPFLFSVVSAVSTTGLAPSSPQFVHLALTGDLHSMTVSYFTRGQATDGVVHYGSESGLYKHSAQASTSTYNSSVGYSHNALLKGLQPNNKYYFVVEGSAQEYSFSTGPAQNFIKPVVIPAYGDMGIRFSNTTIPHIIDLVEANKVDFVLHVGDISYADDYSAAEFEGVWDKWFDLMHPVLQRTPYMVCPGNHESVCSEDSCSNYTGHFAPYNHRFKMPGTTNMYHSFNYGGIHFAAINTETDFPGSPEASEGGFGDWVSWLEKDLKNVDRKDTPWVVAYGHRPIYSTSIGYSTEKDERTGETEKLQTAIERILYENKVDIYVSGHVHAYERDFPVYKNERVGDYPDDRIIKNPHAPIHIIAGSAGCNENLSNVKWTSWVPGSTEWSWFAHRFGDDFGYGLITVYNSTALHWQFFRSGDNGLEDEFHIIRE